MALLAPPLLEAQDSVTVVAGERYDAGGLHRFLFGSGYRDLWTTPIRVPVLDLATFAGGLTPVRRGGGRQTVSLRLRAPDGREFTFRSVDKDPSPVLPAELRGTVAEDALRDQTSMAHPLGALVVAKLQEAVGVLHAPPRLVVMPDDPRLGEFREAFAGMLGMIELRPDEIEDQDIGFAGTTRIVGSDRFLTRIENNPFIRPDARAFLRARLLDVLVGDWDRHRDQWRWALTDQDGPRRWVPIPEDRDQAFVAYGGLLVSIVRQAFPDLINTFGPGFAGIVGQTWNGRDLDRRILPVLTREVWDEVATELQALLTDAVLEDAVRALPEPYRPLDRTRLLLSSLRSRRDGLVEEAGRFYRLLAREVDIHASDLRDSAVVTRLGEGRVRVQIWADTATVTWYERTFTNRETKELRIWLHGDDDQAVVRGGEGGPTVRVLGGGSDDHFVNTAQGGPTRFYDDRGSNTAEGASINRKSYATAADTVSGILPPRDWGNSRANYLFLSYAPDIGLLVTLNPVYKSFGFRKQPQASRLSLSVGWATGAGTFNSTLEGGWWRENSRIRLGFRARASGIEVLRWYGEGNDSERGPTDEFNRVSQHVIAFDPHVGVEFDRASSFEIGPSFKYSVTNLDDGRNVDRFIGIDRPFGAGDFGQIGAATTLLLDGRDRAVGASHGAMLRVAGAVYPITLDTEGDPFGSVEGEVAGYWSPAGRNAPTLALRVGAKRAWGDYPFFETATIGGNTSRGFRARRFAGDAAAWANAEVRVKVADARLVVPGELGVFGLGDVGRVWLEGESSDTWHPSVGGGIWFGILSRTMTVSLSAGRSREGTRFYAGSGFGF